MTQLSIINYVYNIEKYVQSSVESIYHHGLDEADFEIIIVNDGTHIRNVQQNN